MKKSILIIMSILFMLPLFNARADNIRSGDLVKSPEFSSVYKIGQDNKRHPFPNQAVYFSWYTNFSGVKTIPLFQLQTYPLGKNVTFKKGSLFKIPSVPKVYEVIDDDGGVEWIKTEADFYSKGYSFGMVKDLSEVFWMDYREGVVAEAKIEPVVDNSAEAKAILSFIEETIKAQQYYESAKGYIRQATDYVLIGNVSATRSANNAATPLAQQAYNTAMNIPVPILSGNCCSMSLVAIKKFYIDKYSCWSQWLNTMEQTVIEMEELDAALDAGDTDKADEQLQKSKASLSIAENKRAECNAIDNQYPDVYKAINELSGYTSSL